MRSEFKEGDVIAEVGSEFKAQVLDVRDLTYHLWWFGEGRFRQSVMGREELERDFVLLERKGSNGEDMA